MRHGTLWIALLLVAGPALAGCIGSNEDSIEQTAVRDPIDGADSATQWVLDATGNLTDPDQFPGELPTFSVLEVVDRVSGEPTLGITRTGAIFYAAIDWDSEFPPPPAGGGAPRTFYMRSMDGGETWENFSPHIAGQETHYDSADPYVYVDPATSRVYAMDMGPSVVCNKISFSDDDGESWVTNPWACNTVPNDHPTLFAGPHPAGGTPAYPHQAYLCTNQIYDSACYVSPDGGATWAQTTPVYPGVNLEGDLCGGLHGHGHASLATGTVYLGRDYCGVPTVAVSDTYAASWELVSLSEDPTHDPADHDISIATDLEGNAYAFWVANDATSVYLAKSMDDGQSWSEPMDVTPPGVTAAKLPSLVAGSEGHLAFQFIGTEVEQGWDAFETVDDCNDQRDPDCFIHPGLVRNATWNAYIGVSLDAHTDDPAFAVTVANPLDEPVKRGPCSGRCFGDEGGMYDFLDIEIDPTTGQIFSALVDVCHEGCDGPEYDTFSAEENSVGMVARLDAGPLLLDTPIPEAGGPVG